MRCQWRLVHLAKIHARGITDDAEAERDNAGFCIAYSPQREFASETSSNNFIRIDLAHCVMDSIPPALNGIGAQA
jgi:hypothetical protein